MHAASCSEWAFLMQDSLSESQMGTDDRRTPTLFQSTDAGACRNESKSWHCSFADVFISSLRLEGTARSPCFSPSIRFLSRCPSPRVFIPCVTMCDPTQDSVRRQMLQVTDDSPTSISGIPSERNLAASASENSSRQCLLHSGTGAKFRLDENKRPQLRQVSSMKTSIATKSSRMNMLSRTK